MTRVIHTGDTHVGYQQYHSPARREDFRRAFQAVVDDAVAEGVDAVVHAGDLFHDRRPDLPDLLGVLSALRTLDEADIPFLAVVGNHEATRTGEWLDLFEEMGLATRLGADPVVVGDVAFYGLDWVPKSRRDDLAYRFADCDAEHAALVAHGLFTPFQHGEWDTAEVLEESNVAFGSVLLGDNHAPDTAEVEGAWVTYCGSTERASAAEEEPRGYNLVTYGDEVDVRRRSLDTRPFVFVSVDLSEGEGVERVRERVRQHDLTDAVCIVEITGEGDPVTPAGVEEAATEDGALVVRVTDRRELESEPELQVTFADPDDAVRERVSELGLSPAARDVDETVRASKTADSKVREAVESRVEELLDEGDGGAFQPAESPADSADEPVGSDAESADSAKSTEELGDSAGPVDESAADESTTDGEPSSDAAETLASVDVVEGAAAADAAETADAGDAADTAEGTAAEAESTDSGDAGDEATGTDSQGTMEDFL